MSPRQRNISLLWRREVNTSFNEGRWQRALINKELNTFLRESWWRDSEEINTHAHVHMHAHTQLCKNRKKKRCCCWREGQQGYTNKAMPMFTEQRLPCRMPLQRWCVFYFERCDYTVIISWKLDSHETKCQITVLHPSATETCHQGNNKACVCCRCLSLYR